MLHSFSGLMPLVEAGKLRAIAVTTDKRSPLAPDIPTMSEAGLSGYSASTWFSVVAPARTPSPTIARLNQSIVKGMKSPETVDYFNSLNAQVLTTTPQETVEFLQTEIVKWARVVKAAGIKAE
jgi:tripartite-type tricarboxylate transporter receptor subunit TctC